VVLDAKAMDWAAANGIDTAKLKAARIPIYGKWYYPEIPPGVPLVNLKSGEVRTFGPGLLAGEVLFVPRDDLRRARLGPYAAVPEPAAAAVQTAESPAEARPAAEESVTDQPLAPGEEIHIPSGSIFPLIIGFGLAIVLLGAVAGPMELRLIILALGFIYLLTGGIGWTMELYRETHEHEAGGEHGHAAAE
jgi:hypothetical protein